MAAGSIAGPGDKEGHNPVEIDPGAFAAAAFDLDGVITRTASVHAAAWKQAFDSVLQRRAARAGTVPVPFDIRADYLDHIDGKPRLDGVRAFLAARGIALPEGTQADGPESETVHGIGNAKNALFGALLARDGVGVFDTSVALVRALRAAGLRVAVVTASRNAGQVLAACGLAGLFDARIDGQDADRLGLKGKPAPDIFRHAAAALGVPPSRMLGVEDSLAGAAALKAAGYGLVVGVDRVGQASALAAHGAGIVVPDLGAIRLCRTAMPWADPEWTLVADGFDPAREPALESLFAVGNGAVGTRGSLPEGGPTATPATYVAGLFDTMPDAPPGLMTVADWTHLSIRVEGEALRPDSGPCLGHRRMLDFRHATLWRAWRQQDAAGRILRVREQRLASAADRRLLIQSVTISPENFSGLVTIETDLPDTWIRQSATGDTVALAAAARIVDLSATPPVAADLTPGQALRVACGRDYRIDRIVAVHTVRGPDDPGQAARAHAAAAMAADFRSLLDAHHVAWAALWQRSDIRITGDPAAQQAIRFAIYHLLSAANPDDASVSIGARALTGAAYRGHVFWDTEIFMLPFFTLTRPEAARALLAYRYRTLPAARRRAAALGYRGALYAWESADTGDDVTPAQAIRPDGTVVRILTGEQEHHISADVAHGVWNHWRATGDAGFLCDIGAEILLETARFWASRGQRDADGRYHIRGVIGPDEYHEGVDDNAYTNGMAKWNLQTACRAAALLAARWPARWRQLSAALGLRPEEIAEWRAIARDMVTGLDERTGLIAQFEGYFALEDIDLAALGPTEAPMDVVLGRDRISRSQVIKQPDVVMLLHLLWDEFPRAVVEANFRYYEPRCGHGSSLSPAIHALVAARLGDTAMARRYFRQAVGIDIGNSMANAAGGVHAAALGGLWQAVAFGFAGLRIADAGPECHANLPPEWREVAFRIMWRGRAHDLRLPG